MTLTSKLGALMPNRAAAEALADFLLGQMPTRHTTLRHRTSAVGKRLEEKEKLRMFFEQVDTQERRQRELLLPEDLEGSRSTRYLPGLDLQPNRRIE